MSLKLCALILSIIIIGYIPSFAQVQTNDTAILGKMPQLSEPKISNDAKWLVYKVESRSGYQNRMVLQKTDLSWKKEFTSYSTYFFSYDSRYFVSSFENKIVIIDLTTTNADTINNVTSCQWPTQSPIHCFSYQLSDSKKTLVLVNFFSNRSDTLSNVDFIAFNNSGTTAAVYGELVTGKDEKRYIDVLTIENKTKTRVWETSNLKTRVQTIRWNNEGNAITYFEITSGLPFSNTKLWYYQMGMTKAITKIDASKSFGGTPGFTIKSARFTANSRWILFAVEQRIQCQGNESQNPDLMIWNYKDPILRPTYSYETKSFAKRITYVINVDSIAYMEIENENQLLLTRESLIKGDYAVVIDNFKTEYWWQHGPKSTVYIISLKTGEKKPILSNQSLLAGLNVCFSPQNKYLVFYNWKDEHYYCLDISKDKIMNITKQMPSKVVNKDVRYLEGIVHNPVSEVIGWSNDMSSLLLYDNYDIWQIDPLGNKSPNCVTNQFGATNKIIFRLLDVPREDKINDYIRYSDSSPIRLIAFDEKTKENGFYFKAQLGKGYLKKISMKGYTYFRTLSQRSRFDMLDETEPPTKAFSANVWLISRQSEKEMANYYLTSDFSTFNQQTFLKVTDSTYQINTELLRWRRLDGTMGEGILYRPYNFDPQKKYPVIFNFYIKFSHRLHLFLYPDWSEDNINIPWFVSRGYLVFVPDIDFVNTWGDKRPIGHFTENSVISAANMLATKPFVDKHKMAIQAHSFGGMQTSYLLTRSNLFAAAAEACGTSDLSSAYLTLINMMGDGEKYSKQSQFDLSIFSGKNMWESKQTLFKGSAILNADKITTPLLIMHNPDDNQVQWRQGVELFMALRRLGKKSWMLTYKDEGHDVRGKNAVDYTFRLTQFFDYYLKQSPTPKWMLQNTGNSNLCETFQNSFEMAPNRENPED